MFGIDANTVRQWLVEAAEPLQAFSDYFLRALQMHQGQLDELYAGLRAVRDGAMREAEAVEQLARSPPWVWIAIDAETKLVLGMRGGERSASSGKSETGLIQPLILLQAYPNFVLPHASRRQPLAEPIPSNGRGSAKGWRPCTPAMARA